MALRVDLIVNGEGSDEVKINIAFVDSDDAEEKKYHAQKYRDARFAIVKELLGRGKTHRVFKADIHYVIGTIQERIIHVTWFTLFGGLSLIGCRTQGDEENLVKNPVRWIGHPHSNAPRRKQRSVRPIEWNLSWEDEH